MPAPSARPAAAPPAIDLTRPGQCDEAPAAALARDGWCVLADVLTPAECAHVRERLWAAAAESERRGAPTFLPGLDPNAANVRVFNLLDLDPLFLRLIRHPAAIALVRGLVGEHFIISNFTANIARPGSRSMGVHSDLALVFPGPWVAPWSMNIIWCLDDIDEGNGATRYIPGSQHWQTLDEVPADLRPLTRPFRARAGSIVAMDGRMWHTSGANTSADRDRALLFGYYSAEFIRPQVNMNATLSAATQAAVADDPELFAWLGLGPTANVRPGAFLIERGLVEAAQDD